MLVFFFGTHFVLPFEYLQENGIDWWWNSAANTRRRLTLSRLEHGLLKVNKLVWVSNGGILACTTATTGTVIATVTTTDYQPSTTCCSYCSDGCSYDFEMLTASRTNHQHKHQYMLPKSNSDQITAFVNKPASSYLAYSPLKHMNNAQSVAVKPLAELTTN